MTAGHVSGARIAPPASRPAALLEDLDRIAERLEGAARLLADARRERGALLEAAGVRAMPALFRRIEEWLRLEEENHCLQSDRREAAARLRAVIDKVDMLPRDS